MNDHGFFWQPLSNQWKNILNNDHFMLKDCKGDGNCQFRSIETALIGQFPELTHIKLRQIIAHHIKQLNDEDFQTIIINYQIEVDNKDFEGKWDPYTIKTKDAFINEVTKLGMHFQGDNITLGLISKALKIDFLIFNNNTKEYYPIQNDNNYFIFLYYEKPSYGHYKTIGYKEPNGNIKTIFKRKYLPIPLIMKPSDKWSLSALIDMCDLIGLSTAGNKEVLYKRLDKHINMRSITDERM